MPEGGDAPSTTEAIGQLVALVREYGSLPRAIFGLISLYILGGILTGVRIVTGSILYVFDLVVGALQVAQSLLIGAFAAVGLDVLGLLGDLGGELGRVVAEAGPLGPPIAVGAAAVGLFAMYRVGVALVGELPLGSSIVDILRLR